MLEAGPRVKVKALMAGPLLPPWGKERPSEHHLLIGLFCFIIDTIPLLPVSANKSVSSLSLYAK